MKSEMKKYKIFVSTWPFAENEKEPLQLLEKSGFEFQLNPLGRKLSPVEIKDFITDFDGIIAGTEKISHEVLKKAKNLKIISRVGVGLDSVDLNLAKELGIVVTYTPNAPAPAVSELTIGLMLASLRKISQSDQFMKRGEWHRFSGKRIGDSTIGIIGIGRIGSRVIKHLLGFSPKAILVNDLIVKEDFKNNPSIKWVSKEEIYSHSDIISLHVPLNSKTLNMISSKELSKMRKDVVLINTSRGGVVNEDDLLNWLQGNSDSFAALDVFDHEPYSGPLSSQKNCLLTSHMGSMSIDCRNAMELEATKEVLRFFSGQSLTSEVPDEEVVSQSEFYERGLNL